MRNLIYQYWTGNVPYYIGKSVEMMREYAKSIGAEYRVDINDNFFSFWSTINLIKKSRYFQSI